MGLESAALRRRDREAEGAPLLREYAGKTCIEGSNPSVSAKSDSPHLAGFLLVATVAPRAAAPPPPADRRRRERFLPGRGHGPRHASPAAFAHRADGQHPQGFRPV